MKNHSLNIISLHDAQAECICGGWSYSFTGSRTAEEIRAEWEKHAEQHRPRITIIGRRWFQRTYGNTYHSVSVIVDGTNIGRVPFMYGYGDQYIQTAFSILQDKGIYPKTGERRNGFEVDYSRFLDDMRNHRDRFTITVSDVARQKDL